MNKALVAVVACFWLVFAGSAGAKDKLITIGFTSSSTGASSALARAQRQGFELWRDQINSNGGIRVDDETYKIELVSYDDQSLPARVQQLYSRLVLQDAVNFLFGPSSSRLTKPASVVSEQYGKIMLSSDAADGKIFMLGNKYLFQTATPASRFLLSTLRLIRNEAPQARIALVYANDPYSRTAAESASRAASEMGLDVVLDEAYSPHESDFSTLLRKVASSRADVLIGGGYHRDDSALVRQLRDANLSMRLVSLLAFPSRPARSGAVAKGVITPSQWAPDVAYKPDFGPDSVAFARAYEQRYGDAPNERAAGGYVAGLILQHAIEQADSLKTTDVAAALNDMNAQTFYGRIRFSTDRLSHGLQTGHAMVLTQWQPDPDGRLERRIVWPAAAANTAVWYPSR